MGQPVRVFILPARGVMIGSAGIQDGHGHRSLRTLAGNDACLLLAKRETGSIIIIVEDKRKGRKI